MGTKISALTETGSAPTGAYYPLEYENANYKISTETLRANLGGKYTADWAVSHGGTTVANGATLTITHNLGTSDVIAFYYVNSSASDTGGQGINAFSPGGSGKDAGAEITSVSSTTLTLQLGEDGYLDIDSDGLGYLTDFTDLFIKVVVLSAGSGNSEISFRVDKLGSATQQIPQSIETQVTFTNEVFDVGDKYDTSTSRFTPGVAGRYFLTATIYLDNVGSSTTGKVYIRKNGVVIAESHSQTASSDRVLTVNTVAEATSTDYFDVAVEHDYGGYRNLSGDAKLTWFAGCRVGGDNSGGTNKYVADWDQSHGGVTVANGATLTITHNLGTADVQTMVYVNSSASDTNAQEVGMMVHNSAGQFDCGCLVTSLATNSLVVQLGEDGYNDITSGGGLNTISFSSPTKYIKVVVIG